MRVDVIERWKPIPGYEDLYQVSDMGRVRRIAGGMGARVGHILLPRDNGGGYAFVTLYRDGHPRHRTVHTIVMETFRGPCPDGQEVNHKKGIKADNRLTELEYMTPGENKKHSYAVLGRKAIHGEAKSQAKLTDAIVRRIRRLYFKGEITACALGTRYGVSPRTIGRVLRREAWAHVA